MYQHRVFQKYLLPVPKLRLLWGVVVFEVVGCLDLFVLQPFVSLSGTMLAKGFCTEGSLQKTGEQELVAEVLLL